MKRIRRNFLVQNARSISRFPAYFADQPPKKYVTLRMTSITSCSSASLSYAYKSIAINDMYDCLNDTHATQPYGFDLLMEQYDHFTVLAADAMVQLCTPSVSDNYLSFFVLSDVAGNVTTAYGHNGVRGILEMPGRTETLLSYGGEAKESARSMRRHVDMPRFFGRTAQTLIGDARYIGTSASSPEELAFLDFVVVSPYAAAGITERRYIIDIVFHAVLTEPRYYTSD